MIFFVTIGPGVVFALAYLLARRIDNRGIVDIAWTYAFAVPAAFYAIVAGGWPVRRALIGALGLHSEPINSVGLNSHPWLP